MRSQHESDQVTRRAFLAAATLSAAGLATAGQQPPAAAPHRTPGRQGFLLPADLTYCNNGSLGPCPRSVIDALTTALRDLERNPVGEYYGPQIKAAEEARRKAAAFLGCKADEMAVVTCTTEGMNAIAEGVNLGKGDRVLTTDHEHPGGATCWEHRQRRDGIEIDHVKLPLPPRTGAELVTLFAAAMTPRTRVLSVSHVTYTTGLRLPVRRLAALAHAHGALCVVDGAQASGVLDFNLADLGCDAYATSAHKWLLAPKGTGLLYISEQARERIDPVLLSRGMGVYTAATGTRDLSAAIALGTAVTFLENIGKAELQAHAFRLQKRLQDGLAQLPGIRVVSPPPGELGSALTTAELPPGTDSAKLAKALLEKHRVVVKVIPRSVLNGLRVSTHIYNDARDVDRVVAGLGDLLG